MQLFATEIDEAFVKTRDKEQKRIARAKFLETILGRDAVRRIEQTVYKKPYIPGGPQFSLSHSGQWLFLALADSPVGADIEKHKSNRDFAGIARRAFPPGEYDTVMRAENRLTAFYDQWVQKESYLKMIGTGFYVRRTVVLNEFATQTSRRTVVLNEFATQTSRDNVTAESNFEIRLYTQFPGYSAAAACRPGTEWPKEAVLLDLP